MSTTFMVIKRSSYLCPEYSSAHGNIVSYKDLMPLTWQTFANLMTGSSSKLHIVLTLHKHVSKQTLDLRLPEVNPIGTASLLLVFGSFMRQPVSDGTVGVLSETQTVICSYAQIFSISNHRNPSSSLSVDTEEVRNVVTWIVDSLIHMASPATM